MNEDLDLIQKEIEARKSLQLAQNQTIATPSVNLPQPQETPKDKATELVDTAFNQAIVNRVVENEEVQAKLLGSADKVISNRIDAIEAKTDQEAKEANFNNNKNACECFGYNEATTSKWAVKTMKFWHDVMTAIWLFIGFFTFAPITFIAKKIGVIFKKAWVAILLAIIIYLIVVLTPILTSLLT